MAMLVEARGWRAYMRNLANFGEYVLYVALAVLLFATAVLALAGSARTLFQAFGSWSGLDPIFNIMDRLLVVLMLVEILHTVLVSVRSGVLTAEPFLIVGLIASIRRILVITLETAHRSGSPNADAGEFHDAMIEMGVLCALILVLVVSIVLLRRHRAPEQDAI